MTKAEAREIVLETLAFTVGMAVAAPALRAVHEGSSAARGVRVPGPVRRGRRACAWPPHARARRGQSGKGSGIQKALDTDAATIKQENALLERIRTRAADPKAGAADKLSPTELATLKAAAAGGALAYAGNRRAAALNGLPQLTATTSSSARGSSNRGSRC